jgi:Domain of unknown function (DUF4252)
MRIFPCNFLTRFVLAMGLFSLTLPGVAQAGKLQLEKLEKLADKAAEVNDVTLDGSLLQLAVTVLKKSGDPDAAQLVDLMKGLKGIYVKNFEFEEPGQYSQADVEGIRKQLTGPGWQRVVTSFSKHNNERDEVYLLKEGDKVNGVAILVAEARELTVVNIVGSIDPEKLGELGGHFGIPAEIYNHQGATQSDRPKRKTSTKKDNEKTTSTSSDKKETDHEDDME